MKGILIDPVAETVTEVEHIGDYQNIYKLIQASPFTVIDLGDGEALYIDDEGLYRETEDYFVLNGAEFKYPQPLAGRGLILGTTPEGESTDTKLTIETVQSNIQFAKLRCVGFTPPSKGYKDLPDMGKVWVVDGGRPIFQKVDPGAPPVPYNYEEGYDVGPIDIKTRGDTVTIDVQAPKANNTDGTKH